MSINKRLRRADLVISPLGCAVTFSAASVLFVLTTWVWSR